MTRQTGRFEFTATNTGMGLGDFMLGKPNNFQQQNSAPYDFRQKYIGLYLQDTWKANSRLTLNGGVRWEPYTWSYDHRAISSQYNKAWFDQGLKSKVFKNAPSGILFPGDSGAADIGTSLNEPIWLHFAPRLGLAYDLKGDGMTVVRAAYGVFFYFPHFNEFGGIRNTPPRGGIVQIPNPPGGFDDPWLGYPGGNPFPFAIGSDVPFPTAGVYTVIPRHTKTSYVNSWNMNIQKQIGTDWLVSGNYIGSSIVHQLYSHEANPAVYIPGASCVLAGRTFSPCSSVSNTNQRRVLSLQNPDQGQYFSNIVEADDEGTGSYNGLLLSVQRRRARGITIGGNYTLSHCIDTGYSDIIQTNGIQVADRRGANRWNCELDRRHNFNMSTVYETPQFANSALRILAGGWRISGIARLLTGAHLTVSSGLDQALSGTTYQRPNQVLASPYAPNKGIAQWFNPAAFVQPALGTYGTMGRTNVSGPGNIRLDLGVVRIIRFRERQSVEFRAEAFNVANHVNPCGSNSGMQGTPACMSTTLSDANFGRITSAGDPRIMQMALKFIF